MIRDIIEKRKIPTLPTIENFDERREYIKKIMSSEVYVQVKLLLKKLLSPLTFSVKSFPFPLNLFILQIR